MNWNSEKNEILKCERGFSSDEIAYLIESGRVLSEIEENPGRFFFIGWETRIRTWVDGVRVRSPAAGRSPKIIFVNYIKKGLESRYFS